LFLHLTTAAQLGGLEMAYFAKVENNIVTDVISINNLICGEPQLAFPATEPLGQAYIADVLQFDGEWLQCSYNANFRGAYPGITWLYNPELDIFEAPFSTDNPPIPEA
jgi:hypothetical protein